MRSKKNKAREALKQELRILEKHLENTALYQKIIAVKAALDKLKPTEEEMICEILTKIKNAKNAARCFTDHCRELDHFY